MWRLTGSKPVPFRTSLMEFLASFQPGGVYGLLQGSEYQQETRKVEHR